MFVIFEICLMLRVIKLTYYFHVPVIHFDEMASAETDLFQL